MKLRPLCVFLLALAEALSIGAAVTKGPPYYPPQAEQCEATGGIWNYIYFPLELCAYSGQFTDGQNGNGSYFCGHCYKPNQPDCVQAGGQWVLWGTTSGKYRCLLPNGYWLTDSPGFCHGSKGGVGPSGQPNTYLPPCDPNKSDGESAAGQGGIDCAKWGLVDNGSGGCMRPGSDPTAQAQYCLNHPDICFQHAGFHYQYLPPDENCLEPIDAEDPPLCGPTLEPERVAQAGSGSACLSHGGAIMFDFHARRLVCWSKVNANVATARLRVTLSAEQAKSVLANCRARTHSITLHNGELVCIDTPAEVIEGASNVKIRH